MFVMVCESIYIYSSMFQDTMSDLLTMCEVPLTCYRLNWMYLACRTSKMTWTSAAGWQRKNQWLFCQVLFFRIHDSFRSIVLEYRLVQDIFPSTLRSPFYLRCNLRETNCQDVLWDTRIGFGSPLQLIRLPSKTGFTGSSPSACDTRSRQSDKINSLVPCDDTRQTVMNFYPDV